MIRSWPQARPETLLAAERLLDEAMVWRAEDLDLHVLAAKCDTVIVTAKMVKGHGALSRCPSGAVITVAEGILESPAGSFTVAHELGHVVRHPDIGLLAFCEERGRYWQREADASDFAARLVLAPRLLVDARAGSFVEAAHATAARHKVSPAASAQALLDHRDAPAAVAVSKGNVLKWWATSDAFPFKLTKKHELTGTSRAAHFTKDKKARKAEVAVTSFELVWPEEGTLHLFEAR